MSNPDGEDKEEDKMSGEHTDHLENIKDGAGCAEIWEYLSEQRKKKAGDD